MSVSVSIALTPDCIEKPINADGQRTPFGGYNQRNVATRTEAGRGPI